MDREFTCFELVRENASFLPSLDQLHPRSSEGSVPERADKRQCEIRVRGPEHPCSEAFVQEKIVAYGKINLDSSGQNPFYLQERTDPWG